MSSSEPSRSPAAAVLWLVLTGAGLALSSCSPRDAALARASGPAYLATASGRLDTLEEARFLVAAHDGVIESVKVRAGDPVQAGQVLLTVACEDARAAVAAARSDLEAARSRLSLVNAGTRPEALAESAAQVREQRERLTDVDDRLERARRLQETEFVTARSVRALTAEHAAQVAALERVSAGDAALRAGPRLQEREAARAEAGRADAEAARAQSLLEKCEVRSPIAGQVLRVFHREGEFSGATQGVPLIVVGDVRRMAVRAEIEERDAPLAKVDGRVEVWADGGAKRWPGRIREVSSVMGRKTARSSDPADRFDRDTREIVVALDGDGAPRLVGLRVNVGLLK